MAAHATLLQTIVMHSRPPKMLGSMQLLRQGLHPSHKLQDRWGLAMSPSACPTALVQQHPHSKLHAGKLPGQHVQHPAAATRQASSEASRRAQSHKGPQPSHQEQSHSPILPHHTRHRSDSARSVTLTPTNASPANTQPIVLADASMPPHTPLPTQPAPPAGFAGPAQPPAHPGSAQLPPLHSSSLERLLEKYSRPQTPPWGDLPGLPPIPPAGSRPESAALHGFHTAGRPPRWGNAKRGGRHRSNSFGQAQVAAMAEVRACLDCTCTLTLRRNPCSRGQACC